MTPQGKTVADTLKILDSERPREFACGRNRTTLDGDKGTEAPPAQADCMFKEGVVTDAEYGSFGGHAVAEALALEQALLARRALEARGHQIHVGNPLASYEEIRQAILNSIGESE